MQSSRATESAPKWWPKPSRSLSQRREDTFEFSQYELGAQHWLDTGEVLSDETLADLATRDAIILGAVGAAPGSSTIPSGLLERGLLLKLRFEFDQDVNLRPSKIYPGVVTPLSQAVLDQGPVDFVVVREGTEGMYVGNGGTLRQYRVRRGTRRALCI